jgi:hypothetical protein
MTLTFESTMRPHYSYGFIAASSFPARLICVLICVFQLYINPVVSAAEARSPEATAAAFYAWYLGALSTDKDPLRAKRPQLASYVSRDLIGELEGRTDRKDALEEDYFIQAQKALDDWRADIGVSKPLARRDTMVVVVSLGANGESGRVLVLTMIQEDGAWKIRKVQRA